MKKLLISLLLFIGSYYSFSQQHLKNQVDYCKYEVENLEAEVAKLKGLLEVQNTDIMQLKSMIIDKEKEIDELNKRIDKLNAVSLDLMNLAIQYETMGDYRKALEVYKLLIQNYPNSLETAASRLKIREMTKKVVEERVEGKK